MRIVITEILPEATCEVSRKTGECLKVIFEPNPPSATVSPQEFIKLVRFQAQQEAKGTAPPPTPAASRERSTQANS